MKHLVQYWKLEILLEWGQVLLREYYFEFVNIPIQRLLKLITILLQIQEALSICELFVLQ